MKASRGLPTTLALGVGFGATASFSNSVGSPGRTVPTGWARVAEVASLLLGAGWAWAALAVAAGWLVGAKVRGAGAGIAALIAATTTYYGLDSVLRGEPLALYRAEMLLWCVVSLVIGSALGVVGASIRRPGVIGLIAGLTVPVGAAVQMAVLPPGFNGYIANPEAVWARLIVWVAAALSVAIVMNRFLAERFQRSEGGTRASV